MGTARTISYHRINYREPRRDKRWTDPVLDVHIGGKVWQTVNWSLGGMLLSGPYDESRDRPGSVQGRIVCRTEKGAESAEFTGRIIRRMPETSRLAVRFDLIDEHLLGFLERCLRRRIRLAS